MTRFRLLFKRILIGLLLLTAILVGTVAVIIRFYEDEVVEYAVSKIGEKLTTPAQVGKVDLTFWSTFPYASLEFTDVFIKSGLENSTSDTLLSASSVYLSFSLRDIFSGEYTVREIAADNAVVNLLSNHKGQTNWDIWKKSEGDTAAFKMAIESIQLNESRIGYEDRSSEFFTDIAVKEAEVSLILEDNSFDAKIDLDGALYSLISGQQSYFENRAIALETTIHADQRQKKYLFSESMLQIEDMAVAFEGSYAGGEESNLDLRFSGVKINLAKALSILPAEFTTSISSYTPSGQIDLNCVVSGPIGTNKKPTINARVTIRDGALSHKNSDVGMSQIIAEISYENKGRVDDLHIRALSAFIGNGQTRISGHISQLSSPSIDLQVGANVNLSELRDFLAWDTLQVAEGSVSMETVIKGHIDGENNSLQQWSKRLEVSGTAQLADGKFQLAGSNRAFSDVSGMFLFNGSTASVQNFKGIVNGSDFELNGTAKNLIPFLLIPEENLTIDASLKSRLIDFNQLTETNSAQSGENLFVLPSRVRLELRTDVNQFVYKTFEAKNISGVMLLNNGMLTINPVSLNVANGSLLAQLSLIPLHSGGYYLSSSASLKDIDIQKFFSEFDNFGQTFITDSHLRGKANAEIAFSAPLSSSLQISSEKVYSLLDIRIDQGELIGLSSLQEIANYVGENKLVAPFVNEKRFAEKLAHIKFSTLENMIRIENSVIHIPLMEIRSSAMDISVQGTHQFDKRIDYTIGFRLRDILISKEKDWEEADDGLGKQMFIYMRGTTEKPEFGIDKSASKQSKKEEIAEEKQNVKALLKEELGLFKKDNTVGSFQESVPIGPTSTTTIQWDELNPAQSPTEPKTEVSNPAKPKATDPDEPVPVKTKKKVPKWLEEKDDYEKD